MDTEQRSEEGTIFDELWKDHVDQFLDGADVTEEERWTVRTVFYAGMLSLLLRLLDQNPGNTSSLLETIVRLAEEIPRVTPVLAMGVRKSEGEGDERPD